ncbi:hypothetical protein BJ741DRAFT_37861 [Chytriomyces cf. hyalinus JEL632]|nr:hypothetical protein BJ741DRAFT_37861 [Chytriomyces cf. hyalinus JEL632]
MANLGKRILQRAPATKTISRGKLQSVDEFYIKMQMKNLHSAKRNLTVKMKTKTNKSYLHRTVGAEPPAVLENCPSTLHHIMEDFKRYIPKPEFCLGRDKIIDLHCGSPFRQGYPAIDKEVVDFIRAHFGIDAISEVDAEYHAAALLPFTNDSKKTYPQIRNMSEPRFTGAILMPLIAELFCRNQGMYWDGPEAPVHGTAHRQNLYKDATIDRVELPRKADGIVRLQNYDSDGLEALLLEVSGPPSNKDLSKHAEDFFKLGQEMRDSFDHAIFKVQSARKSSQILRERLCVFGIQCWGFEMEISVYFVLFGKQWIVPLCKLKIPSVLKDVKRLKNIEIVMVSIKAFLLKIVKLLEEMEKEPEAYSLRQNSTQIRQTPVKPTKKKKTKTSLGSE